MRKSLLSLFRDSRPYIWNKSISFNPIEKARKTKSNQLWTYFRVHDDHSNRLIRFVQCENRVAEPNALRLRLIQMADGKHDLVVAAFRHFRSEQFVHQIGFSRSVRTSDETNSQWCVDFAQCIHSFLVQPQLSRFLVLRQQKNRLIFFLSRCLKKFVFKIF